jgi:multicomponent Na+:H+ antiporter subunit G
MTGLDWVAASLIAAGVGFFIAGTIGLLRLPDPLSRLHALTKADNLGLFLVVAGLLVREPLLGAKLVLIWILVLGAGATAAHLIAKRAVRGDGEDAL